MKKKILKTEAQIQKYENEKRIHFFSSFEEMNEYDLKEMAQSTPQERFQNITRLIKSLYKKELGYSLKDSPLIFDL